MSDNRYNETQRAELLQVARQAVAAAARGERPLAPVTSDPDLRERAGAFVTLTDHDGQLRGCIGYIAADHPLVETINNAAVAAATRDPRFPVLQPDELSGLGVSISVLGPPRPVRDVQEIEPGRHGLIVRKSYQQGLLLPQVATRYGWDTYRFLEETCVKAGLRRDDWRDPGTIIEVFTAEVFGDGEPEDA